MTGLALTPFAHAVREGLSRPQKELPAEFLYDELGSALFEAITVLPEYGLTRADRRVLVRLAGELGGASRLVVELGSGSGTKTKAILEGLRAESLLYLPIDQSAAALARCEAELSGAARVLPVAASYGDGLRRAVRLRQGSERLLLLFLGSSIGNFDAVARVEFLQSVRGCLSPGDWLLIGFDLVKPVPVMLEAYDDPVGVTAAFNRNVLGRINRELGGKFDLRSFTHAARWNAGASRIEMHLQSLCAQTVEIPGAGLTVSFQPGETIWTESSYKFEADALATLAREAGFEPLRTWIDEEWPFAECLWTIPGDASAR